MNDQPLSPKIQSFSWGELRVNGYAQPFKDAKLFPGGAREWNWQETGTHHDPGIQPADVEELLQHGARIVILSTGQFRRLNVMAETQDFLAARGVTLEILSTKAAVRRYNEYCAQGQPVGALIHSTC